MDEQKEEYPKFMTSEESKKKAIEKVLVRLRKRYNMFKKKDGKPARNILIQINKLEDEYNEIGKN
ncbi:MAG: hypothetical protein ACTSR3_01125 [Candidatus Helarchaeota archaeon]